MFTVLLESVLAVDVILHVVGLVLLNVALILEDKLTARPAAVEVGGLVAVEAAVRHAAVLRGPEPLEAFANQR